MNTVLLLIMGDPKNRVNIEEYMMNAESEAVYVFCLFAVINDRSFEVKGNAGVAQGVIIRSSCKNGEKRQ